MALWIRAPKKRTAQRSHAFLTLRCGIALSAMAFLSACSTPDSDLQQEVAGKFAQSYYNFQFEQALQHCTPESRKWIEFVASNIDESDVSLIRNQQEGASAEVEDIENGDNDSTAIATIRVTNFVSKDSIARPAHLINERLDTVRLVRRDGKWLVHLSGGL